MGRHVQPSGEVLGLDVQVGVQVPRAFRVLDVYRHTTDTVTLTLRPTDGGAFPFAPGQFTMLGLLGIGEVPISISGDPGRPDVLEHTVRDVGGITSVICRAQAGGILTVRGPFGSGWRLDAAVGSDAVVVAGGIGLAPLRPVVLALLADRDRYRHVTVVYGARTPPDLLFRDDIDDWRSNGITVALTVDTATGNWRGRVGLVTALLPAVSMDPGATAAYVCGPELMMRFTADGLRDRGIPAARIDVSMERSMVCGVGLCGHCQFRELFTCVDGPVFGYDHIVDLLAIREL
jgi:NAD(P)H-flavin reductase